LNNDRKKAIIQILIAAVMLSTGGILLKLVDLPSMAIAGSRAIFSAIVVMLYIKKPKFTFSRAQLIGALCYSSMVILFIIANKLTTAANSIVLQFTAPVWVALLSFIVLKERIKWFDFLAIIATGLGMVLFFLDEVGGGSTAGNIVALVSGVALAGVTISLRFQKDGSPIETILLGHLITIAIGLPFIFGQTIGAQNLIGIFLLGTFQLGLSYIFYSAAIKHLTAMEAILIMVLEPILNPLWVFLLNGERPGALSLLGGGIVLITIAFRGVVANR
jgi:drug/metabolite transporter (DMT)-like permease